MWSSRERGYSQAVELETVDSTHASRQFRGLNACPALGKEGGKGQSSVTVTFRGLTRQKRRWRASPSASVVWTRAPENFQAVRRKYA